MQHRVRNSIHSTADRGKQWEHRSILTSRSTPSLTPKPALSTKPDSGISDPAATEANQGYPDMAIIAMTEEQLKGAPDFRYARNPAADLSMSTPAAAGAAATEGAVTNGAPSTKQ